MLYKYIVGIDSGLKGGIAIIDAQSNAILSMRVTPTLKEGIKTVVDIKALGELLRAICEDHGDVLFVLEKTHARPGMSNTAQFSLGRSNGQLEMALTLLGCNVLQMTPGKWMRHLNDLSMSKDPEKRQLETARILWPLHNWLFSTRCTVPHSGYIAASLLAYVGNKVVHAGGLPNRGRTKK